jgi:hypothetical protein
MTARTHVVSQQWTRWEEDSLISLAASGRSARSIAIHLHRSLFSVESRATKLKIRFVKPSSRSDHESLAAGSIAQFGASPGRAEGKGETKRPPTEAASLHFLARCWRGLQNSILERAGVIAEHVKPCFSPGGSAEPSGTPPTQAALFAAGWASTMTRDLNSSAVMTSAVEKARTVKVLRWTSSADSEPCPTSG